MIQELFFAACCLSLASQSVRAAESGPPLPSMEPATPSPAPAEASNPVIVIDTSLGTIRAELWPEKAPRTATNFLAYVDDGFFDGLRRK